MATIPTLEDDIIETVRTNYVGLAGFAILIWDHVDTFADEVEFIWKRKKSPLVYLFLFNRYFTPLGFVINLHAYLSSSWSKEICKRFVHYEGFTVAIAVEIVGVMMLLRVNAMYPRQQWIAYFLGILLLVETGINAWLISRGEPVPHNAASGVKACTMIFDPDLSAIAPASAWMPLLYDSIVVGLTFYFCLGSSSISFWKKRKLGYLVKNLLEDGLLYYSVIFAVNVVLTIMIAAAPPGIKNIAAQLEQLITVAMMSRITLRLKKAGAKDSVVFILDNNVVDIQLKPIAFQRLVLESISVQSRNAATPHQSNVGRATGPLSVLMGKK